MLARVGEGNEVQLRSAHPRAHLFKAQLARDARRFMVALGLNDRELSISLVGDVAIRRLNRDFRRKDKATDVLSFPAGESLEGAPAPWPLGDLVISLDTARRAAKAYRQREADEVRRYLAHGLLHLLGHDHERSRSAARKMAVLEDALLEGEGMLSRSDEA